MPVDLLSHPLTLAVFAALVGAFVGNFLTVVIHRLPRILDAELDAELDPADATGDDVGEAAGPGLRILSPGARCSHCAAPLGAFDTMPIVGYLLRRGRCVHCGAAIPLYMPLVELLTAALFVSAAGRHEPGLALLGAWSLIALLVALAVIDLHTRLLPDRLTLPGLWLGLAVSVFDVFTDSRSAVIGAIVGYGLPWLADRLFARFSGRRGMGRGDFKLAAMLGAWLGWQILPTLFVLAFGAGVLVAAALVLSRQRSARDGVPFGPFLVTAGLVLIVVGPEALPI